MGITDNVHWLQLQRERADRERLPHTPADTDENEFRDFRQRAHPDFNLSHYVEQVEPVSTAKKEMPA